LNFYEKAVHSLAVAIIVVDIFAKAIMGEMIPEEAAEWGTAEVAKRYGL